MTTSRQAMLWTVIIAVILLLAYYLREVLLPFVAAGLIAYLLHPSVTAMEKRGAPRWLGTLIMMLVTVLVLVGVVSMLLPLVGAQTERLLAKLPLYRERLLEMAEPVLDQLATFAPQDSIFANFPNLLQEQGGTAVSVAQKVSKVVISGSLQALSTLSLIFITPVIAFYLLRDWPGMLRTVDSWFPRQHYATIHTQLREIDRTIAGFMRGQLLVCLTLGFFYAIGLTLAGLEFGFVIGILSGLLSFIPYVGSITGGVISLGMALAQWGTDDWVRIGIVAAIYGAGQFIEGNILSPKLVGSRVNLHPVWVIFALFAGGALYGFLGVLLAVPVTAVIGVLARFVMQQYKNSKLYNDGSKDVAIP